MKYLLSILFFSSLHFQSPSITGSWALKTKEYIEGPKYANALPESVTVNMQTDSLIISTPAGETISRIAYPLNGNKVSSISSTSKRKIVRSIQMAADKKSFVTTSAIYVLGDENTIELTRIDSWQLTDDNTLSMSRKSVETKSQNWEAKGIFEKQ